MTKEQILERARRILELTGQVADVEQAFNGALTLMSGVYGEGSQQVKGLVQRRENIMKSHGGLLWVGHLRSAVTGAVSGVALIPARLDENIPTLDPAEITQA
jgi:hypothetical protein